MAREIGSSAYSFDQFFPYFTKSQHFTPPVGGTFDRFANSTPQYDRSRLGTKGPLSVVYPKYAQPFSSWAAMGFQAIGLKEQRGFESGSLSGAYAYPLATISADENTRESSETAFLRPHLGIQNANLVTFVSTLAKRILFDEHKRATGVVVNTDGLEYTIRARKEVIVSAGSFQSPQLLMVSGIGPKETLQQHDINVVHDSPGVGQNMKDHVLFGTAHRVNVMTGSAFGDSAMRAQFEEQYAQGKGPMTNPGIDILGWERLPRNRLTNATISALDSTFSKDWPEVEYLPNGGFFGYANNFQKNQPQDKFQYASVIAGLVATLSTGNITIRSSDMADPPIINPNWFSHPADKELAIAAFKRTREVWAAPAVRPLLVGDEYFPGASVQTDDQIWNFIQKSFSTIFHAACTCKMGPDSDRMAVLDANAKVRGVSGLRVVDASSLPILPPGHPMSTICTLAFSCISRSPAKVVFANHFVDEQMLSLRRSPTIFFTATRYPRKCELARLLSFAATLESTQLWMKGALYFCCFIFISDGIGKLHFTLQQGMYFHVGDLEDYHYPGISFLPLMEILRTVLRYHLAKDISL